MPFCVVFVMRSATQPKMTAAAAPIKRKSSILNVTNNSVHTILLPQNSFCYLVMNLVQKNEFLDLDCKRRKKCIQRPQLLFLTRHNRQNCFSNTAIFAEHQLLCIVSIIWRHLPILERILIGKCP